MFQYLTKIFEKWTSKLIDEIREIRQHFQSLFDFLTFLSDFIWWPLVYESSDHHTDLFWLVAAGDLLLLRLSILNKSDKSHVCSY